MPLLAVALYAQWRWGLLDSVATVVVTAVCVWAVVAGVRWWWVEWRMRRECRQSLRAHRPARRALPPVPPRAIEAVPVVRADAVVLDVQPHRPDDQQQEEIEMGKVRDYVTNVKQAQRALDRARHEFAENDDVVEFPHHLNDAVLTAQRARDNALRGR